MTLKQFIYLAAGSSLAYALFVFLSPTYPLITWPLIAISGLSGLAFAFLPIGSRPLDYWVATFLKTVYTPTKRSWEKTGQDYRQNPLFNSRYVMYQSGLPASPASGVTKTATPVPPFPAAETLPTPEQLGKTVDLARQAQSLQVRIIQAERALNQIKEEAGRPSPIPVDYSLQVSQTMSDLQKLVSEASRIRQQLDTAASPPQPAVPKEKIKVVIPVKPKQTQLTLTSFPNVLNGIVKNASGDYLEGVVAVIYDKEGLPVRALKTNKLGQFSGSTPLPNGTYTLELEKEGFNFDVLQVELEGAVLPPLMITAKGIISS